MATYQELVARINDAFENDKKLKIKAREIEYLSYDEIENLQNLINKHNLQYIRNARKKGLINLETEKYLINICKDPMEIYRVVYKNICKSILYKYRPEKVARMKELNEELGPDEINAIDLDTGEIDINDAPTHSRHMTKYKEYQAKHITPFTAMRLTFYDFRDNPIYVIMPGFKDIRRIIDKIKLPVYDKDGKRVSRGGKYYEQYQKEVKAAKAKCKKELEKYTYGSDEYKMAQAAIKTKEATLIKKIPKPHERIKDIVRLTICRKYYPDTKETLDLFVAAPQYGVKQEEIKDAFHGNSSNHEDYGPKNYRETRVILEMKKDGKPFKVELQIKIIKLYEGDIQTHGNYAGEENEESRDDNILLISHQNTKDKGLRFWEENKKRYPLEGDRDLIEMKIFSKNLEAQSINKKQLREYNLQVLDKAFRLEDAKRANGKGYDSKSRNPINNKEYPIYKDISNFIEENFLYRPFKAFDMEKRFNVTNEELRSLGLVITADQLDDLFDRYTGVILSKYNGRIETNNKKYFLAQEEKEDFDSSVALAQEDENLVSIDEEEILESFNKQHIIYNKILDNMARD